MQYVAEVSGKGQDIDRVKEQLLQSNPVLEGWHLSHTASYCHPTQTSFTCCLSLSPNTNIIFHTLPLTVTQHKHLSHAVCHCHPTQTPSFTCCLLLSPNTNIRHLSDSACYFQLIQMLNISQTAGHVHAAQMTKYMWNTKSCMLLLLSKSVNMGRIRCY